MHKAETPGAQQTSASTRNEAAKAEQFMTATGSEGGDRLSLLDAISPDLYGENFRQYVASSTLATDRAVARREREIWGVWHTVTATAARRVTKA